MATAKKSKAPSWFYYRTTLPVERTWDIPKADGGTWRNHGFTRERFLTFRIPADEKKRFEAHSFFKQGRLIAYDPAE